MLTQVLSPFTGMKAHRDVGLPYRQFRCTTQVGVVVESAGMCPYRGACGKRKIPSFVQQIDRGPRPFG